MAFRAGRVEVELGAKLDRREIDLYEKKLKEIREQTAKKDAFKAQLGGDYNARAFNAMERDLKRNQRSIDENVRAQGRLRTAFGSVYGKGGALFAAAGGIAAVTVGLKSVVKASGEAEVSQRKMAAQLKAAGISYAAHAKEIDKVIQATSKLAGLDDEDLQDAFTNVVRATGSVSKGLDGVRIAADLARAKHIDVAAAGQLVGKVFSGNVGALKRLGIAFDPVTTASDKLSQSMKDQIRALQKQAETAKGPARDALLEQIQHLQDSAKERTREAKATDKQTTGEKALAELRKRVSGQAEAYGKTQQGAFDRVNVAFENLRETIGQRLAPTITRGANALAKFVDQMGTGAGAGGRFVDRLRETGDQLKSVGTQFASVAERAHGHESTILKLAAAYLGLRGRIVAAGAALVTAIGIDKVKKGSDSIDDVRKRIAQLTSEGNIRGLRQLGDALRTMGTSDARALAREVRQAFGDAGINGALNQAQKHFADFRKTGSNDLKGIRTATRDNMHFIARTLGEDSKEGREALAKNFRLARTAIRQAMRDGTVSVREGLAEIQRLMRAELKQYGITGGVATSIIKHGDIKTEGQGPGASSSSSGIPSNKRAGGGWIGAPGLVGGDIIPAMLAPGEAVLNRHQQAVIEGMLGDGFLDRLFETVDRPHYFAAGGRAGGLQPAVASLASRINSMFGLVTTSTTGGQHAPGSYHYQGLAADVSGPASAMFKASEWLKSSGTYRSLLEGIHNPNLAVKDGQLFSGAGPFGGVWANHSNHIHIALRALGAALSGAGGGAGAGGAAQISAPQVGGSGALRAIVQGALNAVTGGANTVLDRAAGSAGGGGGDISSAGVKGGYSKSQLAALWRRAGGDPGRASLMAAIALAESGGNPRAHNPSGASGLWQILGLPFPGDPFNPSTNARMAVAKYESQGLGAWEAYTNGAYRSYLSRGGRARQFFAKGGRAGGSKRKKIKKPSAAAKARDYIRPLASLNTDRVGDWDIIQGKIDDDNTRYGIAERTYDLDVEELIKDDGSIDEGAIRERANELLGLISIRQDIIRKLVAARALARRVIRTYNTIINRLKRSLKHAGKKSRASIRETIGTYTERRDEWKGKLHELEISTLPSARLDLRELVRERGEVLGTKAEPADVSDTGGGDLGGDTSGDTSTDTTAAPASPADIAAAALADLSTFNQSRSDMLGAYARNFISAFQAGSPGGVFSGSPDELSKAAGVRFFGAGGSGGLGGATIVNNYNQLPDNTQTWSQQMRFQLEAA